MSGWAVLGWMLVASESVRVLVCLGIFARGRSLRYGCDAGDLQAQVHGDLERWRRVAGVEAVFHAALMALYLVPLVFGPPPPTWYVAGGRLAVAIASVVGGVAMAHAMLMTLAHWHVYQAIDRGLRR